ncbi:MAG: Flp pilus assembly complex ATPase component TadA [Gammaproteobacteria bacterium]|nr:Flp pilus assembly complex ATPase component TadA [Gammaproteobacteria bacterium]MCP5195488.1 Flp pilus assembly complex ATPase component TadA [Gammaproteobacteria bacterium]
MNPLLYTLTPVQALKQAIAEAFPERTDLDRIELSGTLSQSWQAFARLLTLEQDALARVLAPIYGVPVAAALKEAQPSALALVPSIYCQENDILPLRIQDGALVVATANPLDANVDERTRFLARKSIEWVLAPPQAIEDAVVLAYSMEALRQSRKQELFGTEMRRAIDDNAIVRLARGLLTSALEQRASDLHIQPFLGSFVVRIRVDGALQRIAMLPDATAASLIRHLKARSGMEPTNSIIPQDGRMSIVEDRRDIDLRVSSLPASRGERLVIRFLDQSRVHRLNGAGFPHAVLQTMRRGFKRPSGMVLMTGPTGSGKTSTLYGMLAEINHSSVNIITVENPVEYRIPGISQVEVNEKAGRTFMTALRSILRQDPDVVLIGEIRDTETAEIACQAALTGHLVLSTLHTNDALTAIPRLLNLGLQPSILADSLAMVVAQRLCRALCPACRIPVTDPLTPEERIFTEVTHNRPGFRAVGCTQCGYTGYYGRLPIVDIVEMNKALRDAVALGESRLSELDKLRANDLKSLAVSGSGYVISGHTTVGEVMAAVGPSFWPELADHYGAVCFDDALDLTPKYVSPGQTVLLIGGDELFSKQLEAALEQEGLHLAIADRAEKARTLLESNENIAFILGDLPDDIPLAEAIERLRRNRLHISWARLPALVLIPETLAGQEPALRESGVLAAFMSKPVSIENLLDHIWHAKAT